MTVKEAGKHTLRFRAVNRDIFDAIKNGKKKIETRAATERYRKIRIGDTIILVCGKNKINKRVRGKRVFKSFPSLMKKYRPDQINPAIKTEEELLKTYYSFPKYKEKIKRFGIIALSLK
jgi:ASC-1-like (ASCH) protein